jgi:hypothetical protein
LLVVTFSRDSYREDPEGEAWLHQKSCRALGGRGCAKNPADRKFTLSSRFAFHLINYKMKDLKIIMI